MVVGTTEHNTKGIAEFSLVWASSSVSKVFLSVSFRSLWRVCSSVFERRVSKYIHPKKGILLTPNQRAWLNFSDYTHWSILWKLFPLNQFWTFYLTAYSKICSCRQNRSKYKLLFPDIIPYVCALLIMAIKLIKFCCSVIKNSKQNPNKFFKFASR